MKIILSNSSEIPIYEQIKMQLKSLIVSGELKEGQSLPGMRTLAKDLKVSVITTKRAYNDLEQEGYIYTTSGVGSFVNKLNSEDIKEEHLKEITEHLQKAVELSNVYGVSREEVIEMLRRIKWML